MTYDQLQFSDGSGNPRGARQGRTARTVPLGSKHSSLTLQHVGHGTLTAATVWPPPLSPLPAHFSFTPTNAPQLQQAKSRSTSISIMKDGTSAE